MKRSIVSLALCFLATRLALLAGAEESIKNWAAELDKQSFGYEEVEETFLEYDGEYSEVGEIISVPLANAGESGELALSLGEQVKPAPLTAKFHSNLSIRNDTSLEIDPDSLLEAGPDIVLSGEGPQVLIIHTHGSEAYTPTAEDMYTESDPYRTEDREKNVVRVGDVLAESLESKGIRVLHDREIYDYPSYTGSYSRSGAAVEKYLAEYPGISVVIDLHRDALGSGDVVYKTRAETESGECAQVMLLVGTGENGLYHPLWEQNLSLALYLQQAVEEAHPSLMRPLALKSERYNQHLSPGAIIVEVGSTGNTMAEAIAAIELFGGAVGDALAALEKGNKN